jgi:lipoate-protein ligase A
MTRHGEYKTAGGKLIAVEFDVEAGALHNVVVTGDFFLYPEEALAAVAASLEGAPASLAQREFAARVDGVLARDVELLGSSSEALAAAVVRALQQPEGSDVSRGG